MRKSKILKAFVNDIENIAFGYLYLIIAIVIAGLMLTWLKAPEWSMLLLFFSALIAWSVYFRWLVKNGHF